ncbi:innexin-11-like [Saccostrea echinata]|uniref:innexin-11-like n=1 Tax=Saccostrea echinata TaxID=191078 RepID=UPI002A80828E|nr:innexin-11-like [Saccostrea echinata]
MTRVISTLSRESWVDKLNGKWTPLLFLILGLLAFLGPLYFSPIECNFPVEFTEQNAAYGKSLCYEAKHIEKLSDSPVKLRGLSDDTVFLVANPDENHTGERTLYQYVSLILILQAIFLRIPFMVWKLGEKKLGIHFTVCTYNPGDDSKSMGKRLAVYIQQWIQNRKINILSLGALTLFHCFIKLLYFVSASTHLGLLDPFLKQENETSYGSQILGNIKENNISLFQFSPAFPRHVFCEYGIVNLQNIQKYLVQCTLPLNPYLEQMMAVAWWWLIFTVAATVADGLLYFFGAVLPFFRLWFVKSNLMTLELGNSKQALSERNMKLFADSTLGEDVISFLKQVQENENGCMVMEAVTELWKIQHGDGEIQPAQATYPPHQSTSAMNLQTIQTSKQPEHIQGGQETPQGQIYQPPTAPSLYPSYATSSQ